MKSYSENSSDADYSKVNKIKQSQSKQKNSIVIPSNMNFDVDFTQINLKQENADKKSNANFENASLMDNYDFTKLNNDLININTVTIRSQHKKSNSIESSPVKNSDNLEKSLSSLKKLDIGTLLTSINLVETDADKLDNSQLSQHSQNSQNSSILNINNNSIADRRYTSPSVISFGNDNTNPIMFSSGGISTKSNLFDLNLNNIFSVNTSAEDNFDPNTIKKQIRGVIIEKGILLNSKGKWEDVKYRGQIALELSNNFTINVKFIII